MKLTMNYIKNLAYSEEAYADGFTYFKNGRVMNVTSSKNGEIFQLNIRGNQTYQVVLQLLDKEVATSCICSAHVKYDGACKPVIAGLLFLYLLQCRNQ